MSKLGLGVDDDEMGHACLVCMLMWCDGDGCGAESWMFQALLVMASLDIKG